MDTATIVFAIGVVGCVLTCLTFAFNRMKDSNSDTAQMTRVETQLGFISEDVKDTKAEIRAMRSDAIEAKQRANEAYTLASSAHDRLDAQGAPTAHVSRGAI